MKNNIKQIIFIIVALLFSGAARSQLFMLPEFTGSSTIGSYVINVTPSGSVSTGGGSTCIGPTTNQYWIGPGGVGSYTYTFSRPVYQVQVYPWGINSGGYGAGEYFKAIIDGTFYPITASNVLSYTECGGSVGGPCYLYSGLFMGPNTTSFGYNGGQLIFTSCTGMSSFECYTNGIEAGIAYTIFIDTVRPLSCVHAINNGPCINDTLWLNMIGDSTGSTYVWYGPGGFTSTLKNPFIYPATFADTGLYIVIRTQGGFNDTSYTDVIVHPLPPVSVSSNIPMCAPDFDTLLLFATPDSSGETFSWTGPNGFTSNLPNPVINPFDSSGAGTYFVKVVSRYGCKDSSSIYVYPGIDPGFTFNRHYGCNFDTVYFTNTTVNANGYSWNFGDGTPTDANRNTYHVFTGHNIFNVTLSCTNPHCDTSITIPVDLRHQVKALFYPVPDTVCVGQPVTFQDTSYSSLNNIAWTLYSSNWTLGDGATSTDYSPVHAYADPGIYTAGVVVTDSIGCEDSISKEVYVLLLHLNSFNDTTLCLTRPLQLTNVLSVTPDISLTYAFHWSPGAGLSDTTAQIPDFDGVGLTTYTLTATIQPYGCPVTDTIRINSVMGKALSNVTPTTTIALGSSIQLNADSETIYWWKPNDGSLDNPNINDPIATPGVTTLYTVYGYDNNGCLDSAFVDIIVDSTLEEGLPSGFTPNGDGLNDEFRPLGARFQRLVEFRIFNRWGQQVFYSENPNRGWDGTYEGVAQESGTYFYTITVASPSGEEGINTHYKGEVTLIR